MRQPLELMIKYEQYANVCEKIKDLGAQIINTLEIKHNRFLLLIIKLNEADLDQIIDIGFNTFRKNVRMEDAECGR